MQRIPLLHIISIPKGHVSPNLAGVMWFVRFQPTHRKEHFVLLEISTESDVNVSNHPNQPNSIFFTEHMNRHHFFCTNPIFGLCEFPEPMAFVSCSAKGQVSSSKISPPTHAYQFFHCYYSSPPCR